MLPIALTGLNIIWQSKELCCASLVWDLLLFAAVPPTPQYPPTFGWYFRAPHPFFHFSCVSCAAARPLRIWWVFKLHLEQLEQSARVSSVSFFCHFDFQSAFHSGRAVDPNVFGALRASICRSEWSACNVADEKRRTRTRPNSKPLEAARSLWMEDWLWRFGNLWLPRKSGTTRGGSWPGSA